MARRAVVVRLKWEAGRTNAEGRGYAVLRWMAKGKRQSRTLGYVTEAEAEELRVRHEASLRLQVASPIDSSAESLTVADVLALYLYELERRPISTGYAEMELSRCVRLRERLGHERADTLHFDMVAAYVGGRRREVSARGTPPRRSSLQMEVDTLRRAFTVAVRQGRVSPRTLFEIRTTKIPDDRRPPRRLTEAEVSRLVQHGHRDVEGGGGPTPRGSAGLGWLIQVLAWSGRRPVAVFALEVEDLSRLLDPELEREEQLVYWRRDKGGISRGWGPITEAARDALLARADEVGTGPLWGIRSAKALHRPFARVARAARVVDVQPYDLRRFGVTRIVHSAGGNLKTAMVFTGHTHVETLLRYLYSDDATDLAGKIGWSAPRMVTPVGTPRRRRSDDDDP